MKTSYYIISGLLILISISVVHNMIRFHYDLGNALTRTFMYLWEDTKWASGLSEDTFAKIRLGMSQDEVLKLLGEPLRKTCDSSGCEWVYTWQKTGVDDFDRRDVIFNQIGTVESTRHEFYVD
ncbi:outer membrane protein assembly factor BamE [Deltaproteobacteria bacterium TL4]